MFFYFLWRVALLLYVKIKKETARQMMRAVSLCLLHRP